MKLKKIKKQNKKSVSPMIAYILLVVGAIAMGGLVYQWMKSYVPADEVKCDDGVSVLIESAICTEDGGIYNLDLKIKNNGRFSIAGVYIKATKDMEAKIATENLVLEGNVYFHPQSVKSNSFSTGKYLGNSFPITSKINKAGFYVEVTPMQYKVVNNKNTEAFCGSAQVRSLVMCEDS